VRKIGARKIGTPMYRFVGKGGSLVRVNPPR